MSKSHRPPSSPAETKRSGVHILVAEHGDGTPWLMLEPDRAQEDFGADLFVGLALRPGTTHEQAKHLARLLNVMITEVSITTFIGAADGLKGRPVDPQGQPD